MIAIPSRIFVVRIFISGFILAMVFTSCRGVKYRQLHRVIQEIRAVNIHAHPVTGHREFAAADPYPTLEPPLARPFWARKPGRIAVWESLQAAALSEIYGYRRAGVSQNDLAELAELSKTFWTAGEREVFNRLLDMCGIDICFSNSATARDDLDRKRVLWVPFVDPLFYPFDGSGIEDISPELRDSLAYYSRTVNSTPENP